MNSKKRLRATFIIATTLVIGASGMTPLFAQNSGSGSKFYAPAPNYRGMSTGVTSSNPKGYYLQDTVPYTYSIDENTAGDVQISTNGLEGAFLDSEKTMPGATVKYKITIVNNSKHVYAYQDQSLTIAPVVRQDGVIGNVGFDGQDIAIGSSALRTSNKALKALFNGKTPSFEQMMEINDFLKTTPRLIGEGTYDVQSPLTAYYLDYYNKIDGTTVEKLEDLSVSSINNMINSSAQNVFQTTNTSDKDFNAYAKELLVKYGDYMNEYVYFNAPTNDKKNFSAAVYESEPELAALAYDNFYNELFSVKINDKNYASVGDVMRKDESFNIANEYLKTLQLQPGESATFTMNMNISGANTRNPYALYESGTYFALDFVQTDKVQMGSLTVNNTDELNEMIMETSTYSLSKDDNGTLSYLAIDGTWTTDINLAAPLQTTDGTFSIPNLPYGTYRVQQTVAPKGYDANTNSLETVLDSDTARVTIINKKTEATPPPVDPDAPVDPEVPVVPEEPETPIIPNPILPVIPTTPINPIVPFVPTAPTPVLPTVTTPVVQPETETVTPNEIPNAKGKTETVNEKETPKAKGTNSAAWALVNLIATLITILLALILLFVKHHKDEDTNDKKTNAMNSATDKAPEELPKQRRRWTKVACIVIAIVSIIIFISTEDMSLPMIMVDKWTLLMIVIAVIQVVVFFYGRHWKEQEKEKDTASAKA